MPELDELIGAPEAAQLLDVSKARLYAIARTGRIGRMVAGHMVFTRAELDAYKASRQPQGGRPPKSVRRPLVEASPA